MPTINFYTCQDCSHEQDANVKDFSLLSWRDARDSREWFERHTNSFLCDDCMVCLTVPREVDVQTWQRWKADSQPRDHAFVVELIKRIDAGFANESAGWIVDIGRIDCPYCRRPLVNKVNFSPKCEECGSTKMKLTGQGIATLRAGIVWPPPPT